jgi:hypothetical protein
MLRYSAICVVGIMTEDEQVAVDFSHLWVTACHEAAKAIELNEQFAGKVETFEIVDNVPPRSPS